MAVVVILEVCVITVCMCVRACVRACICVGHRAPFTTETLELLAERFPGMDLQPYEEKLHSDDEQMSRYHAPKL